MIKIDLSFSLPQPWQAQTFEMQQVGPINYLVGPNGSGKSQFAAALLDQTEEPTWRCTLTWHRSA